MLRVTCGKGRHGTYRSSQVVAQVTLDHNLMTGIRDHFIEVPPAVEEQGPTSEAEMRRDRSASAAKMSIQTVAKTVHTPLTKNDWLKRAADLARREKDGEKSEHGYKYRGSGSLLKPAFMDLASNGFLIDNGDDMYSPNGDLMP